MNDKMLFKPRVIWRGKISPGGNSISKKSVRIVQANKNISSFFRMLCVEESSLDALGNEIWMPTENIFLVFEEFIADHITLDREQPNGSMQ